MSDDCTDLTGGYYTTPNNDQRLSSASPTLTVLSNALQFSGTVSSGYAKGTVFATNQIDVINFQKITIELDGVFTKSGTGDAGYNFGFTSSTNNGFTWIRQSSILISQTKVELDISDLTGKQNFGIHVTVAGVTATMKIKKIYMSL